MGPGTDNLQLVFAGWVDALRRNDLDTIDQHVHPNAVWQGLRPDLICGDRAAIIDNVRGNHGWLPEVARIELQAQGDQVLFSVYSPDLADVAGEQLDEQIHQVFTIADGLIIGIDEHRTREPAIAAMQERQEALDTPASDRSQYPPAPVELLIPFVHVSDVGRSVAFYEHLGFELGDTYRSDDRLDWASLEHADARIMLARAEEPIRAADQAILFYLYTSDLQGLQRHLRAHGHRAGAIRDGSPGPAAEMRVSDPDGYVLMIAQRN
jgi:hypothetical protein